MKHTFPLKGMVILAVAALAMPLRAETGDDLASVIEVVRGTYQMDRQTVLAERLPLTEAEAEAFWPLYREYRVAVEKIGDGLVKLVLEYGDVYPDVPEDRARQILKEYLSLEEKLLRTRATYLKRAGKKLPAAKVLRWAQLENRMDLTLRLQLAGSVPLVPVKKS